MPKYSTNDFVQQCRTVPDSGSFDETAEIREAADKLAREALLNDFVGELKTKLMKVVDSMMFARTEAAVAPPTESSMANVLSEVVFNQPLEAAFEALQWHFGMYHADIPANDVDKMMNLLQNTLSARLDACSRKSGWDDPIYKIEAIKMQIAKNILIAPGDPIDVINLCAFWWNKLFDQTSGRAARA